MISTKKPSHIMIYNEAITQLSVQFASGPNVDFIVQKEGIMTFERLTHD